MSSGNGDGKYGRLYVVATPIGNLMDLSPRAVEVLGSVDLVAAEDTRHSRGLFEHFGIKTRLVSFHDFSSTRRVGQLIELLREGKTLGLISDAGTPAISDPGYELVRQARAAGVPVLSVPGPSALTAAISISGMASDRFVFEGFLPARQGPRRERLEALRGEPRTLVFYESPHRILDSLADLVEVLGAERELLLARELTKKFETSLFGRVGDILESLQGDRDQQRGEFVLVVAGVPAGEHEDQRLQEGLRVLDLLLQDLPVKRAARLAAAISGASRNTLYQAALDRARPGSEET